MQVTGSPKALKWPKAPSCLDGPLPQSRMEKLMDFRNQVTQKSRGRGLVLAWLPASWVTPGVTTSVDTTSSTKTACSSNTATCTGSVCSPKGPTRALFTGLA